MLLREKGRRREDRRLLPRSDGTHGGGQRDHGLPRADIAEEKTTHRCFEIEIRADRIHRPPLGRRERKREALDEARRRRRASIERGGAAPFPVVPPGELERNLEG